MTKPPVSDFDKLAGNRLKPLRQQQKIGASTLAEVMDTIWSSKYRRVDSSVGNILKNSKVLTSISLTCTALSLIPL